MSLIFITGSGRRLGSGLALKFAKHGWDIVVSYNNSSEKADETFKKVLDCGVSAMKVKMNVTVLSEIEKAFDDVISNLGVPNVLVNNSGVFPNPMILNDITEEAWDNTMGVNLKGEFLVSQVFARFAPDRAKIINIASLGALEIWRGRIPYNVSKAGVIQLTKALAAELAPKIAVNCVNPGTIVMDEKADHSFQIPVSKIPMQRYGTIDDVFEAVNFFATNSHFITGQILNVDGGYHFVR